MKSEILQYLRDDPRFRERKNKAKGIANIIAKKYGDHAYSNVGLLTIHNWKDKRDDIIGDILSADIYWRMALADHAELRGTDYDAKDQIENDYVEKILHISP